jgi:SHS2 domain-containing protein
MAKYDELPVYKASYDLLLGIFDFVKDFKREYKYTLGEELKKEAIGLVMLIYKVNGLEDKIKVLKKARAKTETIRLLLRIIKDLRLINISRFVGINKKIEKVSRQLTGWQKSIKV